jgi:hypothetical protein
VQCLDFSAGSTDYIDFGSGSSMDDLNAGTIIWCAYYPSLPSASRGQWGKVLGATRGFECWRPGADPTALTCRIYRSGGQFRHDAIPGCVLLGWNYLAFTWDLGTPSSTWQRGTLTAPFADMSGGVGPDYESGTVDDAGGVFRVGDYNASITSEGFTVAHLDFYSRVLSLAECESWRLAHPPRLSSCVGDWHIGRNGTGVQVDHSGNGNHGTVSGPTVSALEFPPNNLVRFQHG